MKCVKCENEVKEEFKVCPYCGAPIIQNPVTCPHCNMIVSGNYENCSECGKRLDGKIMCPSCGIEVEKDYKFCPKCATILVKEEVKKKEVNEPKKEKKINPKLRNLNIVHIAKHAVLTIVSLLVFIFSFTNIYTLDIDLNSIGISNTIETKMSAIDAMSTWSLPDDYNMTDFEFDYADELEDFEEDIDKMKNPTEAKVMRRFAETIEETNAAKYAKAAVGESEVDYLSLDGYFTIVGIVGLMLILVSGAYFLYCVYGLCKVIVKKDTKQIKFPIFEAIIMALFVMGVTFVAKLGIISTSVSGMFITILVLAIINMLIKVAINIYDEYKNGTLAPLGYLYSGVKIVLATIVMILLFNNTISIKYVAEESDKDTTVELEYNMQDFISHEMIIDSYNISKDDKSSPKETNLDIEETIITFDDPFINSDELLKVDLIPTSFEDFIESSYLSKYSSLKGYVVASYLSFATALILVGYIAIELSTKKKRNNVPLPLVGLGLSVTTLVLILVSNKNYIDMADGLDINVIRRVSMLATPIVVLVLFAFLSVFQVCLPQNKINEVIDVNENKGE